MFLEGVWKGQGTTDKNTQYSEEITTNHVKGPIYMYTQKTKKLPENTPLHSETGYFRVFPNEEAKDQSGKIELTLSHPFGLCEIEEGTITKNTIELKTTQITRTSSAQPPFTTEVKRKFWLDEQNNLNYTLDLGTTDFPTKPHLKAQLKKQN